MNTLSSLLNFFNEPETNGTTEQTIPLLDTSEYKVAIAIDIGTDGIGIAYAYNNEVHSHTEWEYSKADQSSIKLKTQILLNSSGKKIAFGKDAEIKYTSTDNSTSKNWMLFKNIKTHLYDIEHINNIDIETIEYTVENGQDDSKTNPNNKINELAKELTATNGKTYSSELVFIELFKHIKQECKSYLTKNKLKHIKDSEIEWILLVPAIFSEKVKYKLKKWAEKANLFSEFDQCRIVYESDAASLFIQHELYNKYIEKHNQLKDNISDVPNEISLYKNNLKHIVEDVKDEIESDIKFEKEMQYILVDAGGTIEIACHEIVSEFGSEMGVKEILPSISKCGSVYIDNQYKQLLINIFTKENIEEYIEKHPNGWTKCMDRFRIAKENFFVNEKQAYNKVELPKELIVFLENKLNNLQEFIERIKINFKNNKTKNKKMIKLKDNKILLLSVELWKSMFNSVINPLIQNIEQLLESELLYNVQYLCLVGGLAESKYFQKRMKKAFGMESMFRLQITIPSKPILSIVLGGAYLSITPNYIKERILNFSYGIEIDKSLNSAEKSNVSEEHINKYKYCNDNGEKYFVKKCFSVYAKKNQKIKNGQIIEKMYNRTPLNVHKIKIKIFYSAKKDPIVTDCDSVIHLADLILNFDDKNTKRVVVQFHFYDTLIKVYSYPNNQKEKMQQIKLNYALNHLD